MFCLGPASENDMIKRQMKKWRTFLRASLAKITKGPGLAFKDMIPSKLPKQAGVYLITVRRGRGKEIPYYAGRSKNLRQRLYGNHLMGPTSNARLKKYLVGSGECKNVKEAKQFIRQFAIARWIEESDVRKRGAIEGYITAVLFPKYGIYEEH